MRRAVRITRQAISPRLAIRMRANTLALPGGLALLEEGGDAFASLGRGAALPDTPGGVGLQRIVDRPVGDIAHEPLDARMRSRTAGKQVLEQLRDECVELGGRHKRGKKPDAQRFLGPEYFRSEEVTARRARADGAQ